MALALVVASCSRVPGYVIQPDEMALLLADIHIGEGLVERDLNDFRTDSSKRLLKQSIYARHGVTSAQFDTSMVWYGHHLEKYHDIYDRTIEILEARLADANANAVGAAMAVSGDSVDVWNLAHHFVIDGAPKPQLFSFAIGTDENWLPGDAYSWKFKTVNNTKPLNLRLMVDYNDGFTEVSNASSGDDGWHNVHLSLDSTRTARRVYGVATFDISPEVHLFVDSMSLVRSRVNPIAYSQRYHQRTYGVKPRFANVPAPQQHSDSLAHKPERSIPPALN